jgi:hypothetical protein
MFETEEEFDNALTGLLRKGIVEIVGVNSKGEFIYQFNKNITIS